MQIQVTNVIRFVPGCGRDRAKLVQGGDFVIQLQLGGGAGRLWGGPKSHRGAISHIGQEELVRAFSSLDRPPT